MSFVRFKKEPQTEVKAVAPANKLNIRIDVAAIPVGQSKTATLEDRETQTKAIEKLTKEGKDLFRVNETVMESTAGERLYQTKELYGQVMSVEDLIPKLTSENLTLRVNAIREGEHAESTCMELKTGQLANALEAAGDKNNEKTVVLSVTNQKHKGELFVTMKQTKGKHFINKVDYKIAVQADDKLHLN